MSPVEELTQRATAARNEAAELIGRLVALDAELAELEQLARRLQAVDRLGTVCVTPSEGAPTNA